jgi:hypothetical protein
VPRGLGALFQQRDQRQREAELGLRSLGVELGAESGFQARLGQLQRAARFSAFRR